jgi:threonylcarbamoyladenosine tRNA methylthiotransferase MtaB
VRKFFIQNFGCRATQADGAALESLLGLKGMEPAHGAADAELVILNTCTVTSSADEDVRKSIHRVHRENPGAQILVTGCYAQRSPQELSAIPGVTWVVGNSHKTQIPAIVELETPYHGQIHVGDILGHMEFLSSPVEEAFADRTRPNLKIQDGCNNVCSFCIIPSVRGRSRSMSVDEALAQVRSLGENYREVVLTGVNLGRWGRDPQARSETRMRLSDLLERILAETAVQRLRISSVEPMDFTDELLRLMAASPRIAKHVHAPLQSGSDGVLKRMKRRYRTRHYEDRLRKAHDLMPWAAFGADVMTGFPGETDEEFRETVSFIESLPFTYLHVFTYSERPGTPAAALPQVPHPARKERTRILRELAAKKNLEFRRRLTGRRISAVTLADGSALSENYVKVELAAPRAANQIVDVEVGGISAQGVREAALLSVLPS